MIEILLLIANILSPPAQRPLIALTFDDGACTPPGARVVKILDEHKVKATFFPKWKAVRKNFRCMNASLWMATNYGPNEYGIHGWEQGDINNIIQCNSPTEIVIPADFLHQFAPTKYPKGAHVFYRPSSGIKMTSKTRTWIGQIWDIHMPNHPFPIEVTWTFDTRDIDMWNKGVPGIEAIPKLKHTMTKLFYTRDNHIVLMHDNLSWTPKVLKWFLGDRRTKRVEFVTMSEFAGRVIVRLVLKELGDICRRIVDEGKRFT